MEWVFPDGYAERGRGFNGMRSDAEQMGGALIVESGEGAGGTTITCVVPHVSGPKRRLRCQQQIG